MGPCPQPQPKARLPAHTSCYAPSRSRFYPELPRTHHQYRQRRRLACPRARDFRLLRFQSRPSPHEQSAGKPPGQARYYKQHDCVRSLPEQDDEGHIGEVQGRH